MQAFTPTPAAAPAARPDPRSLWPFAPLAPWQLAERIAAEAALRALVSGRGKPPAIPIGEAREIAVEDLSLADRAALIEAATAAAEAAL